MSNLPVSLSDLVRDRIQKDFVSLIPEENWKELVEGTIKIFTQKKDRGHRGNDNFRQTSDLEELILADLTERTKVIIKAELSKSEYQSMWDGMGQQVASEVVQQLCEKHGQRIFTHMIGTMVSNVMQSMRHGM